MSENNVLNNKTKIVMNLFIMFFVFVFFRSKAGPYVRNDEVFGETLHLTASIILSLFRYH